MPKSYYIYPNHGTFCVKPFSNALGTGEFTPEQEQTYRQYLCVVEMSDEEVEAYETARKVLQAHTERFKALYAAHERRRRQSQQNTE